ncbi:MAG: LytR/AlgR family response regulator transcription factor [Lewinella sp.]
MSLHINQSKVLLLDSNDSFSDLFKSLLSKVGVDKIFSADCCQEASLLLKKQQPHVCILDVEDEKSMKTSLDFATNIRGRGENVPIIFLVPNIHNKEKYGKALTFKYSNVLSKDLSPSRLLQAIKYALLQLENSILSQKSAESKYLTPNAQVPHLAKRNEQQLFFKIGDSFKAIEKDKISLFFAENKLTYARVGKRNFPTNVQLKTLESTLFPHFIRCHKKYIVNVSHIQSISTKDEKIKVNDEVLPIGYSYRKSLLNNLNLLR